MKSITYLMSGIVIEDSAMLVDTMTFLFPSSLLELRKALSCSSLKTTIDNKTFLTRREPNEVAQAQRFASPIADHRFL